MDSNLKLTLFSVNKVQSRNINLRSMDKLLSAQNPGLQRLKSAWALCCNHIEPQEAALRPSEVQLLGFLPWWSGLPCPGYDLSLMSMWVERTEECHPRWDRFHGVLWEQDHSDLSTVDLDCRAFKQIKQWGAASVWPEVTLTGIISSCCFIGSD